MKIEVNTPEGRKVIQYWGVSYVKERTQPKLFIDPLGNYNRAAHERAIAKEEQQHWEGSGEPQRSPMETHRSGYYMTYAYIFGKVWHVGVSQLARRAARLHDSVLFHLWGFYKNPKTRFNLASAEQYLASPPELFPEVEKLRAKLIAELTREGSDVSHYNLSYADKARR